MVFLLFLFMCSNAQSQVGYSPASIFGWQHNMGESDGEHAFIMAPGDIIFDCADRAVLPKKWRVLQKILGEKGAFAIAGSVQCSAAQMGEVVRHFESVYSIPRHKIYVLDLREEWHGYINGDAVSVHGGPLGVLKYQDADKVMQDERERFAFYQTQKILPVYDVEKKDKIISKKTPHIFQVRTAQTEEQVAHQHGVNYFRLPITDHFRPEPREVDRFLTFVQGLPIGSAIYTHCRGGCGRTTTIMVLYDILMHRDLSLDQILERHVAIGGTALGHAHKDHLWTKEGALKRLVMIHHFYEYTHDTQHGLSHQSWQSWLAQKHPADLDTLDSEYKVD